MAKIMLVEDDNNLREIYAARLQAEGYVVVAAKDGEEALVIAKSEKPDLIISDIMMPKISGFEMLDILRNTDGLRDVKIIMLTALGQTDDEQRANRLGADRYLVKSQVTLEDIVKVCQELLTDKDSGSTPSPQTPTSGATAKPPASPPTSPAAAAVTTSPAVAAPVTSSVRQDTVKADEAASTDAQETATVDTEVESFVAGATTDAPPPSTPPTPPSATAAASSSTTANQNSDDKLLTDAADAFATNASSPTASNTTTKSIDQSLRKKNVIAPIDSQPKKDLATLLAQEEAKEAAAAIVDSVESSAAPPAAPANPAPPVTSDPNNIAL